MRYRSVSVDIRGIYSGRVAHHACQLLERRDLLRRRRGRFEVSDQTYSDAVFVEVVVGAPGPEVAAARSAAMRAGHLTLPARADVDLPVFRIDAVADHKVIAEPVLPLTHRAMVAVHALGRVHGRGGVMHDDHAPFGALNSAGRGQVGLCKTVAAVLRRSGARRRLRRWRRRAQTYMRRDPVARRRSGVYEGIRQRTVPDVDILGAAAQGDRQNARANRNPLHPAHSILRRAERRAWSCG